MSTLKERLNEAEAALHALQLGRSAVEVRDQNGEMVRYTPANRAALSAYIQTLKQQLDSNSVSGPLGFYC